MAPSQLMCSETGQGAVGKGGKGAGAELLWVLMGWITLLGAFCTVSALETKDTELVATT